MSENVSGTINKMMCIYASEALYVHQAGGRRSREPQCNRHEMVLMVTGTVVDNEEKRYETRWDDMRAMRDDVRRCETIQMVV